VDVTWLPESRISCPACVRGGPERKRVSRGFHCGYDAVFSQGAGSRWFFSIRKELIPSSVSLRVLAERSAQKFAACPALLVR
jgi:hypothetical protein